MSDFNRYGPPRNIDAWEREFKQRWTERVEQNDTIIGAGYAERQKEKSLSMATPIDLRLGKHGERMTDKIERGAAVEAITERLKAYTIDGNESRARIIAIDVLADVPGEKEKTAAWERDREKSHDGIVRYSCSNCRTWNDRRSVYCPTCGAKMKNRGTR